MRTTVSPIHSWKRMSFLFGQAALVTSLSAFGVGCQKNQANEQREEIREQVKEQRDEARERAEEARKDMPSAAEELAEARQKAAENIGEAQGKANEKINDARQAANEKMNEARQAAGEKLGEAREEAAEAKQAAGEKVRDARDSLGNKIRDEHEDVVDETRQVDALVAKACSGMTADQQVQCPIDKKHITAVRNVDDGVALRMAPTAGAPDILERQVSCYQARALRKTAENQPAAVADGKRAKGVATTLAKNACLLDMAGVKVDVEHKDDRAVDLELTAKDDTMVNELRRRAQQLTAQR